MLNNIWGRHISCFLFCPFSSVVERYPCKVLVARSIRAKGLQYIVNNYLEYLFTTSNLKVILFLF